MVIVAVADKQDFDHLICSFIGRWEHYSTDFLVCTKSFLFSCISSVVLAMGEKSRYNKRYAKK